MSMPLSVGTDNPGPRVVAVIVTHSRHADLFQLLTMLSAQTQKPDAILVVDNGGREETAATLGKFPAVTHLNGRMNLGGAGGFALGMMHALTYAADFVWVMDDDGYPATKDALKRLMAACTTSGFDAVAPLVIDRDDPKSLAFAFRRGFRLDWTVAALQHLPAIEGFGHLFNGLLIRRDAVLRVGVPDLRLFIRGDEVDFMLRMKSAGLRFATIPSIHFLHPAGHLEVKPLIKGWLHVVVPPAGPKRDAFFRNRGYIIRRHRLWLLLLRDLLCYPWFFFIQRRGDLTGLAHWARAMLDGARNRFEALP